MRSSLLPFLLPLLASGASAQFFTQKITAPDGTGSDRFGNAIAQNEEWLVVGAPQADVAGTNVAGAVYVYRQSGAQWTFHSKLTAPAVEAGAQFGFSVATQPTLFPGTPRSIVVGAKFEDAAGTDSGAVHVYRYDGMSDTWGIFDSPLPADVGDFDAYGQSVQIVALSDTSNLVAAGSMLDDDRGLDAGAVFVHEDTTTDFVKIFGSDTEVSDFFGVSVSLLDPQSMLVGAVFEDSPFSSAGAAYLWDGGPLLDQAGQDESLRLAAPDAAADDFFGISVSLSNNAIVIGAEGDDDNGSASGSVYVWDYSPMGGVGAMIKRTAPGGASNDSLGFQVDTHAEGWVASIRGSDIGALEGGAALYASGAGPATDLVPSFVLTPDVDAFDTSSTAVSANLGWVMLGTPQDDDLGNNSGSISVFFTDFIDCDSSGVHDYLEVFLGVGADCNANGQLDICESVSNDCNGNGIPDSCEIADGSVDDKNGNGIPDECEEPVEVYCDPAVPNSTGDYAKMGADGSVVVMANDFELLLEDLPTGQFGFFLASMSEGFIPFPNGSDGILCLAGTVGRFNRAGEIWNSGATGAANLSIDLTDMPPPLQPVVFPGQTWHFQAWYRDNGPGFVSNNFSNALRVQFE